MKNAATSLTDIVLQPAQTTFTSRVALAPYSTAVNVGSYYRADGGSVQEAFLAALKATED